MQSYSTLEVKENTLERCTTICRAKEPFLVSISFALQRMCTLRLSQYNSVSKYSQRTTTTTVLWQCVMRTAIVSIDGVSLC
jgi:hypothetical protein